MLIKHQARGWGHHSEHIVKASALVQCPGCKFHPHIQFPHLSLVCIFHVPSRGLTGISKTVRTELSYRLYTHTHRCSSLPSHPQQLHLSQAQARALPSAPLSHAHHSGRQLTWQLCPQDPPEPPASRTLASATWPSLHHRSLDQNIHLRPQPHGLASPEGSQGPPPPLLTALKGPHLTQGQNSSPPHAHKALQNMTHHLPTHISSSHRPPHCSSTTPGLGAPQGLCTGRALCRKHFPQSCTWLLPSVCTNLTFSLLSSHPDTPRPSSTVLIS